MTWNDQFLTLFDRCASHYRSGNRDFTSYYDDADHGLLADIGYKTREFFDFVEDHCDAGNPTPATSLLVAAVRRDFFHAVQKRQPSDNLLTYNNIPTFGEQLDGIPYLPRIIAKARAKLRGELDPDIMFCCGGDRQFLHQHGNIHPADFLRHVWAARDDDSKIAHWIKQQAA
ncbi:MAG: DUF5069 domain-containing protein [Verrucomicrobiota bacterium JB025]|nr:DUF5069 domain-containing protein [Verrucomicrobiota bacterium JB025]